MGISKSLVISLTLLVSLPLSAFGEDEGFDRHARPFLERHCLRCHTGETAKASLDLSVYRTVETVLVDREDWIEVRDRVRHHEMPPKDEPRPEQAEIDAFVTWLHATVTRPTGPIDPGHVPPRRLNRIEYRNTVRDLFGVDFDPTGVFPADDVGHGFDNNADVLSLSPLLFEKYLTAAERIAARAVLDPLNDEPPIVRREAADLKSTRGRLSGQVVSMATAGESYFVHDIVVEGRYTIRATVHGQQAGPEVVKAELRLDARKLGSVQVSATHEEPGVHTIEARLAPGEHRIGIAFVNDYYNPKDPNPKNRDRNMYVHRLELIGPLGQVPLTSFQRRWYGISSNI